MTQNNDSEAYTWGAIVHLAALIWLLPLIFPQLMFINFFIPFLNILGPLVIWLLKKNQHPFINDQGKESVMFQIYFTICSLLFLVFVGPILYLIAMFFLPQFVKTVHLAGTGILLGIIIMGLPILLQIALVTNAAFQAKKGKYYRYPLVIWR